MIQLEQKILQSGITGKNLQTNLRFPHRNTRHLAGSEKISCHIFENEFSIIDYSTGGVALVGNPILSANTLVDISITAFGETIYQGKAQVIYVDHLNSVEIRHGLQLLDESAFPEDILALTSAENALSVSREKMDAMDALNPEVCKLVLKLSSSLLLIKAKCEAFSAQTETLNRLARERSVARFSKFTANGLQKLMKAFNRSLAGLIDIQSLPPNSAYHSLFEEQIYPIIKTAHLAKRAHDKPRGYAGDYEVISQMYRNGFEGEDLFGKIFHHYVANEDSSQSVRFRKDYFTAHYLNLLRESSGEVRVLVLAAGPAAEIWPLLTKLEQSQLDRLKITLVDVDQEALDFASEQIAKICREAGKTLLINCIHTRLRGLFANDTFSGLYHLIYSAGMFDYLDNRASTTLIRHLFKYLTQNGKIVVGNFTPANNTKAFCHLIAGWHLIHKTLDEMKLWVEGLSDCTTRFDFDENEINAFIVAEKHGDHQKSIFNSSQKSRTREIANP